MRKREKMCSNNDGHLFKLSSLNSGYPSVQHDPEVVNMKGKHFKIRDAGGITLLLHGPREEALSQAFLVLVAQIPALPGSAKKLSKQKRIASHARKHVCTTCSSRALHKVN